MLNDDDVAFPKNYMPATVFWNIYDHFADKAHKSPSRTGMEIDFSNTTIIYRQFVLDNPELSMMIYAFMVSSLKDAEAALKRLTNGGF